MQKYTIIAEINKRIGSHVRLKETIHDTIFNSYHDHLYTMQFFLGNPRSWGVSKHLTSLEKQIIASKCRAFGKTFYVHANYTVQTGYNIAKNRDKSKNFVSRVLSELTGIPGGLVIHIGKGSNSSLESAIEFVNNTQIPESMFLRMPRKLVLENTAGQRNEVGNSFEELITLFKSIKSNRVGLCIDTQHSFAAGMVDWRKPIEVMKFFTKIDKEIPNRLSLFHLNDSNISFGGRVDRHTCCILKGYIWNQDDSGLKCILKECYRRQLDIVLETGGCPWDREMLLKNYFHL